MEPHQDLFEEVRSELAERKDDWERMATDLAFEEPPVSRSWIEQVGRGRYKSQPSYARLAAVARWLRENPKARA